MSEWQAVCAEQQLAEGEFQVVWEGDTAIAVYRTSEGWFAVEDVCTHDGAELAGGAVLGCVVECPRHGARFDLRTGEALCAPAYEPIHVFPIKIENGVSTCGMIARTEATRSVNARSASSRAKQGCAFGPKQGQQGQQGIARINNAQPRPPVQPYHPE